MCLIVLAWKKLPGHPLVVAANRDEFHGRPASPAAFWSDKPSILAGRDLEAKGTWMGVARNGRFPMVEAERTNHGQAGGPGDSGGPVFSLPSPDNGKVIAKGIIQGPDTTTTVPCSIGDTNRTGCAWRFFYADVSQALAFYGASIITS